jgi:acyl carrier protein
MQYEKELIAAKIRTLLTEKYGVSEDDANNNSSSLNDDCNMDSLDMVEFTRDIERDFGIEIPDHEVPGIKTVGDVIEYVDHIVNPIGV